MTFATWIEALTVAADRELADWDPACADLEFVRWLESTYAAHGEMPLAWINPLIFERRRELAEEALSNVKRQVERDLGPWPADPEPAVYVAAPPSEDEPTGILGCGYTGRLVSEHVTGMATEIGDAVQEWIVRDRSAIWPLCPGHGLGLHAEAGAWVCRQGPHRVAAILAD